MCTISLPKSVRRLEARCFANNINLNTVVFLEGSELEFIGRCCFRGCRINQMVLPASVKRIGYGIVSDVESVIIDKSNPYLVSDGEFL